MIYEFGSCELDTARRQLSRHGVPVHIEPQVFDLLCFLVERRDRAVAKDEIFSTIWGGRAVSDAVLTTRIRSLRKLIDDEDDAESKIRTLHRIGYRFNAPVSERSGEAPTEAILAARAEEKQPAEPTELRYVTVAAFQPRLDLDRPFDPDRMDQSAARLRAAVTEHLETADDALVEGADGTLFAVIGTKRSRETDAVRAAGIALAVSDWATASGLGLASGLADGSVANHGDRIRGDALLKAAQAAALACGGETMIAEDLAGRLGKAVQCRGNDRGLLLDAVEQEAPLQRPQPPFVGRIVELGLMERAVEAMVAKHSGGCITLEGAAGVGKSRMVARAIEMISAKGGRHSMVYARELAPEGVLQRNLMRGFGPALDGLEAHLAGLPPQLRRAVNRMMEPGNAETAKEPFAYNRNLALAVGDILRKASERAPLLIVLEDAHWIDGESEKLALDLAGICAEMQVILLVTGRPSARALLDEVGARAQGDIVAVTLGPLSERQSRELVAGMAMHLDAGAIDRLVEKAQGNPLFLTRLAETVERKGIEALAHVPATIQSVVQVQFDQLPDRLRANLRDLSVLGERFERIVAATVYGERMAEESLVDGFLRDAGGGWLQFSHNLVRESIYQSLTGSDRKRLHTRAAQALVEHDPLLAAEHAMRGDLGLAPEICVKVARDTFHFRRHGRSLELIEQALQLPCTPDQKAQLHIFLGSAKADLGDDDAAMEHYRIAAKIAQSSTPAVFAMVRIARIRCRRFEPDAAEAALEPVAGWLARDPGPGYLTSETEETRSVIARLRRDTDEAILWGERALTSSDHPHPTGRGLAMLAWACLDAALFETALRHAEACREIVNASRLSLVEPCMLPVHLRCQWHAAPGPGRLDDAHLAVDRADWIGYRTVRMQTRVARLEIAFECGDAETFAHDREVLEAELCEMDIAEREKTVFLTALDGLRRGDDGPVDAAFKLLEGPGACAFLPLYDLSDLYRPGPVARPETKYSPLEALWRARLTGDDPATALPDDPDAMAESAAWRDFTRKSPLFSGPSRVF